MTIISRVKKRKAAYDPYFQNPQQQQQQQERQYYEEENQQDDYDFGDTRSPVHTAKQVERNPTPPGVCNIMIGGRPIDLHTFEDYMVWKVSPYQLRTLLRYHNARTIEEIKNYTLRPSLKMKKGSLILIVVFVIIIAAAIGILMFAPELTNMVKGFI